MPTTSSVPEGAILRLIVRNHPGVMSHICGLFSRRSFNLDGIICVPLADAARSEMLLMVKDDARLAQLILQLQKLHDVIEVHPAPAMREAFDNLAGLLR
ncbi:MAG TPA: ACT domain-containing protein [Candidatus Binataceae bacterium]|nr:ACT domain-containing protein [Candidatus Binataceae bacterium]